MLDFDNVCHAYMCLIGNEPVGTALLCLPVPLSLITVLETRETASLTSRAQRVLSANQGS